MEALEELVKRLDRSMDEQKNARIDKQIHFTLAQASGNVLLLNILEACSGVIDTFIWLSDACSTARANACCSSA